MRLTCAIGQSAGKAARIGRPQRVSSGAPWRTHNGVALRFACSLRASIHSFGERPARTERAAACDLLGTSASPTVQRIAPG